MGAKLLFKFGLQKWIFEIFYFFSIPILALLSLQKPTAKNNIFYSFIKVNLDLTPLSMLSQ